MVSIMNKIEVDRNPNVNPTPGFSYLAIGSLNQDPIRFPSDPISMIPKSEDSDEEARIPVDPPINSSDSDKIRIPPLDPPTESLDSEEIGFGDPQNQDPIPRVPSPIESESEAVLDMNGFEVGDMVWGKVKSHPWWPGHIFNEEFAAPSVRRTKKEENSVLVAFFGDSSYGWFDPAELVPYAPTLVENARQTNQRSFIKAVEESVDETMRRAALGISCRCRNPYNFRRTRIPEVYEVDVVGYESGICSRREIVRAREDFKPEDFLGFLGQLAVLSREDMPRKTEVKSVEWYENVARAMAFRKARFEEFDDTYAEAFGQTVEHKKDEIGVPRKVKRAALLGGSLKIAEEIRGNQSKNKSLKKKQQKKDKYVLKRRDDRPFAVTSSSSSSSSLPDAAAAASSSYFPPQQKQLQLEAKPAIVVADSSPKAASTIDYVLQKREPVAVQDFKTEDKKPNAGISPFPESFIAKSGLPSGPTVGKVKKIKKHPRDEWDNKVEVKMIKKKTKVTDEDEGDSKGEVKMIKKTMKVTDGDEGDNKGEVKMMMKKKKKKNLADVVDNKEGIVSSITPRPASPPISVDLGPLDHLEFPDLVTDLLALALDPFYGVERNVPSIVCHVFLKFRSLVYAKSVALPSENDGTQEDQLSKTQPKEKKQRDQAASSPSKSAKLIKRLDDASQSARKRPPSDRQAEKSAKRIKKLDEVKSLASRKKVEKQINGTAAQSTMAEPGKKLVKELAKQEPLLPLPPKKESPTFLILKFPTRSTLPSVANLKARFVRFGPLDVDSTRVFWRSHQCRVLFKYKSDAVRAYSCVRKNDDIFGQIRVDYSIKELDPENPEAAAVEPHEPVMEPEPVAVQPQLANANDNFPRRQLKSILKKPGSEEAGKENQRVKFKLSVNCDDVKKDDSPPPSSGLMLDDLRPPTPVQTSISSSFLLPPPPPLSRRVLPSQPLPPYIMENRCLPMQFSERHHGTTNKVDISPQLMSLLMRCEDVVGRVKLLPGYGPFRAM